MFRYEREIRCGFDSLLTYMIKNHKGIFTLKFGKRKIVTHFETLYEDENEYDLDDPRFDEFNTILFAKEKGGYLEINYKNLPDEIIQNGKLIYKKEDGILVKVEDNQ